MFYLLRRLIAQPLLEKEYANIVVSMESHYRMLRFADFWQHLGWVLYYEEAYLSLRHKWEAQAYNPKTVMDLIKKIVRK
jgi:hypothetical protein